MDRIVSGVWRLKRCLRLETGLTEYTEAGVKPYEVVDYLTNATRPRTPTEMKRVRAFEVADEGERLERMMRYETAIERQTYRALAELERLQAARTDMPFPRGRVIDVEPTRPEALPASSEGQGANSEMGSFGEKAPEKAA